MTLSNCSRSTNPIPTLVGRSISQGQRVGIAQCHHNTPKAEGSLSQSEETPGYGLLPSTSSIVEALPCGIANHMSLLGLYAAAPLASSIPYSRSYDLGPALNHKAVISSFGLAIDTFRRSRTSCTQQTLVVPYGWFK